MLWVLALVLVVLLMAGVFVAGLWLGLIAGRRLEAEGVDDPVHLAQRQLFDLTSRAYRAMLDEARRWEWDRP